MAILLIGIDPDVCDFCSEPTHTTYHLPQTDMHLCWDCSAKFVKSNRVRRGRWLEALRRLYARVFEEPERVS